MYLVDRRCHEDKGAINHMPPMPPKLQKHIDSTIFVMEISVVLRRERCGCIWLDCLGGWTSHGMSNS